MTASLEPELVQRLELFDDKGTSTSATVKLHTNNNNESVRMVVMFGPDDRRTGAPGPNKLGPPAKFLLNEWLTVTHEVNFAFKDIPLP